MTTTHGSAVPPADVARWLRRQADLTSEEVGARFGVTGRAVRSWERSVCTPTPQHAEAWAALLARLAEELGLVGNDEDQEQAGADPSESPATVRRGPQ